MKRPARKPMTLEELDAVEDATDQRYELWHGEPVAMTGGTLKRNLIALGLARAIYPRLQPGCRVAGGTGRCLRARRTGGGCAARDRRASRIAALGLSLPLREVYADVLADLGN